ncbi:MAG: OmpP1/FadL family transporter [Aminivibrio sp.]|jgi:long-chain fatty acid transport protein
MQKSHVQPGGIVSPGNDVKGVVGVKYRMAAAGAAFLLSLVLCCSAFGAGFALYDFSARGNALGGAMVGRADDPSAIALNPAGITQIGGSAFLGNIGFLQPFGTVDAGGLAVDQIDRTFILPSFYYTKQMSGRTWFGLGVMPRFGLGTDFPEGWFGRYNSYRAMIESISVNPNIAWKVNDSLSLSLGVEALWFEADLRRKIPMPGGADGDFRLKGDDIGWGWNVGLHYKMDEDTRFGLHYRSRVKLSLAGNAALTLPGGADSTGGTVDMTLPEMFMFGISRQLTPKLNVEAGAIYTGWSSYDTLTIAFDRPFLGVDSISSPKNWGNVWRYQLGFEYNYSPEWTWRLGYTYDQEPMPDANLDYLLPTGDRQLISIGFGYKKNNWALDLAYTRLISGDRNFRARPGEGIPDSRSRDMGADILLLSYSVRF